MTCLAFTDTASSSSPFHRLRLRTASCLATSNQSCCCIVISSQLARHSRAGRRPEGKKAVTHLLGGTVCILVATMATGAHTGGGKLPLVATRGERRQDWSGDWVPATTQAVSSTQLLGPVRRDKPPEIAPAPAAQPAGNPRQGAGQADSKAGSGAKLLRAEPQVTMCAGSARRQRTGEAQRGDATAAAADTVRSAGPV